MVEDGGLLGKLEDVRRALIVVIVFLVVTTIAGYFAAPWLMGEMTKPLKQVVYLSPAEAFMAQLKVGFALAVIVTIPLVFWQIWRLAGGYISTPERRMAFWLMPAAFCLFVLGAAFAYFGVVPVALRFFLSFGQGLMDPMISLNSLVSFVIGLVLPFGLVFELPIIILFLSKLGLVTAAGLREKRKFAVLVIFVAAAALTPSPDIFSQVMMAVPMLILYEVSIYLAAVVERRRAVKVRGEE